MALRRFAGALVVALAASAGQADTSDIARLAQSERLRTYALARTLDVNEGDFELAQDLRRYLARNGFYHLEETPEIIHRDLTLKPTLSWNGNVNGGIPGDRLIVGGLVFEVAPERRAREGAVVGATLAGDWRLAWDEGRFFQVSGMGSVAAAPSEQVILADTSAEFCARNHLANWTFFDFCLQRQTSDRDLSQWQATTRSLTLSRAFTFGHAHRELSFSLSDTETAGVARSMISLSAESLWARASLRSELRFTEPAAGEAGPTRAASVSLRWLFADAVMGLRLSASETGVSGFLGLDRQDRRITVEALRETSDFTVSLSLTEADSTVSLFDDRQVAFRITLKR